jgi:C4-dicarboxylate-specific signal transduction histidine kinase
MDNELEIIRRTGLQFYGKMSASISHEIKNTLAIINENAGLLEDFALMAEQGGAPIDPERLKTIAGAVLKQIGRADGIVKNLNQFAHSVDEIVNTFDLNEIVELVIRLSARFAAMRNVNLNTKLSDGPVMLKTIPFFLMNLLWLCLDFVMDAVGSGRTVELVTEKVENGGWVMFSSPGNHFEAPQEPFPTEREKILLSLLKAELAADTGASKIILKFSSDINK